MSEPDDPFASLAALAREEHALILDGRFEELDALGERRDMLLSRLPRDTPAHAEPHLREAARLQAVVTAALTDGRAMMLRELGRLGRSRDAARGYGGSSSGASPLVLDAQG